MTQPPLPGLSAVGTWLRAHLSHARGRPIERYDPGDVTGRGFTWWCRACSDRVAAQGATEAEFQRASGDCECALCGLPYHRHPHSWHGHDEPFLTRLCDGRLVHL